ncbi:hypothetical protein GA0061100_112138 [Rhizobium hainanense]|uniref:Uncharacterized protein n=1 Tax=Rhizobium hainanense TaxID=52131 RepID=A0A1C3W801_9HYPH|nr:hypothetical protein GA0061100_112138 [Rhizobium hainanense]
MHRRSFTRRLQKRSKRSSTNLNSFRLILLYAALFAPATLSAQETNEAARGLLKILDLDRAGEAMISYCETAAPATAPLLKAD